MAQLARWRARFVIFSPISVGHLPGHQRQQGCICTPLDEPVVAGEPRCWPSASRSGGQAMPALVSTRPKACGREGVCGRWAEQRLGPPSRRTHRGPDASDWKRRTWAGSTTPHCVQLHRRVLWRIAHGGDLLERLDAALRLADRLTRYRRMRDASKTRPIPTAKPVTRTAFVRHPGASRASARFPAGTRRRAGLVGGTEKRDNTSVSHLATHTEDHPLEYATFEGTSQQVTPTR